MNRNDKICSFGSAFFFWPAMRRPIFVWSLLGQFNPYGYPSSCVKPPWLDGNPWHFLMPAVFSRKLHAMPPLTMDQAWINLQWTTAKPRECIDLKMAANQKGQLNDENMEYMDLGAPFFQTHPNHRESVGRAWFLRNVFIWGGSDWNSAAAMDWSGWIDGYLTCAVWLEMCWNFWSAIFVIPD